MGTTPKQRLPGRPRLLTAKDLIRLKVLVEAQPDLSLRQIGALMEERCGKRATITTWSRALRGLGLRQVRSPRTRTEVSQPNRQVTRYQAIHRCEPGPGCCPSSLTDHEWEAIQPILDVSETRGRPAQHDRRAMWDAVFYLVRSGASWRMLPGDLPPYKAVFAFFARARDSGLLERVYEQLHTLWRERSGLNPMPIAGAADSQSVRCQFVSHIPTGNIERTAEKRGSADSTRGRRSRGGKGSRS